MFMLSWVSHRCSHCLGSVIYVHVVLNRSQMFMLSWVSHRCSCCLGSVTYVHIVLGLSQMFMLSWVCHTGVVYWPDWDRQDSGHLGQAVQEYAPRVPARVHQFLCQDKCQPDTGSH